MLDIAWTELLLIGVIALLVVGPKELPGLLRTVGRWAGKARGMAREFQRSMEDAAREADLEEFNKLRNVKREVENMAKLDYSEQAKRAQSFMTSPKPKEAEAPAAEAPTPAATPNPAPSPAANPAPTPAPEAPKSGTHD